MACFLMPSITAIVHTLNDELRLGRALETLRPCDEILIVDHGSTDETLHIARDYAATIRTGGCSPTDPLLLARHDWIFCLLPSESISEDLEASLFEWKIRESRDVSDIPACSMLVREETASGWSQLPPSTRLIPRSWTQWEGQLPSRDARALGLQGPLLRFRQP
jgi:hypothetical protein